MKNLISTLTLSLLSTTAFSQNLIDFSYKQESSDNNQPNWHLFETTYTNKSNQNYWQFSVREHERYRLKDNELFLYGSNLIQSNEAQKTFLSYSLGAGDFNNHGYLPEYRAGFALQRSYADNSISPIFEYKYSKYQTSSINYISLSGEKYIDKFRFLAGIWVSDSSFYKPSIGFRGQASYYLNDTNSINYYYSTGKEPEIVGQSTKVYQISSHAITAKFLVEKNLSVNLGVEHTINHGNYKRTGLTAGISYAF